MISLIDETYYSRAWCALEVSTVVALRKAWEMHAWYVYDKSGSLVEGPHDPESTEEGRHPTEKNRPDLVLSEKQEAVQPDEVSAEKESTEERTRPKLLPSERQLTDETERPKLALLEWQCKLLV